MFRGNIEQDMYQVLMPIDDDEERVSAQTETVLELLRETGELEVTLLHVFDDDERAESTSPAQLATGRAVRDRLTEHGATIDQRSRSGDPAEEILATAREIGANMIVLGGRKRSQLGALMFGSVSQKVVREARRPVAITGSADVLERPSHRCVNCGETYYTKPETKIETCRKCGGVHVESLEDEPVEAAQ